MKLVKKTVSVLFHLIILIMLTNCGAYVRHQVKSGETLYAIGWRYDIDHEELAEWNDIPPPYLIHEGQWIRLSSPIASLEQSEPARKQDKKHIIRKPISKGQPKTSEQQTQAKTIRESKKPLAVAVISQSNIEWQWPTKGKVTKYFSSSVQAKRGIDIEGIRGQDIVAAASGTVVYGGSGLIGLGKLVIIKHNKAFLSAYAHNDEILVKEGQVVSKGEKIARMGDSGTERVLLHFEIRKNGKPVDPIQYLVD